MSATIKAAFFDGIADEWDGWEDLDALSRKLARGLDELGVGRDERVVDIGCGTGNLTRALLDRLSPEGRVLAVDISPRMIAVAKSKVSDARVSWHIANARVLSGSDASFDRVICYSVWPHFDDPGEVAAELRRLLRPGGRLHVWHLLAREKINEIHASAGEAVRGDVLPAATETAALLERAGFEVERSIDDAERYLVTARRPVA